MKIILTIKQQDIEPGYVEPENVQYYERYAARAVLLDESGRVALLHSSKRNYYKLPGGGVEKNEDMSRALARELLEEVGAEAEVTGEIGRVEEWRDNSDKQLHQVSDAYLAKVIGDIAQPDFTEEEIADGFSVVWADDIQHAIELVKSASTSVDYEVLFMSNRDSAILVAALSQ